MGYKRNPTKSGAADVWGHGTRVGGAAVFGDLREQFVEAQLSKSARLISAKVITDDGQFYDRRTLPSQMRIVFERLTEAYGCRIFVISLGDDRSWFERGRVGPWAMPLDELARELNVLIFVSAGNRYPRNGNAIEQSVTQYPAYLLEEANRVFEPAGAANVVTVGSVSHASGLADRHADDAHVRAITTGPLEPSPFTRSGPGAAGITKPDFVELGGTMVYSAVTRSLQSAPQLPESGIVTHSTMILSASCLQRLTAPHFLLQFLLARPRPYCSGFQTRLPISSEHFLPVPRPRQKKRTDALQEQRPQTNSGFVATV